MEPAELGFEFIDVTPWEDQRVLAFVGRIGGEGVRPTAAAGEGEEGTLVQPGEADLGDGAGAAADDDAGVAREGHEEIAGIADAAGDDHGGGPAGGGHFTGRDDADDKAAGGEGAFGGDAGGGAAAAADDGDAEAGEAFTGLGGHFKGGGAGVGTAKDRDLGAAVGVCCGHGEGDPVMHFGGPQTNCIDFANGIRGGWVEPHRGIMR